MTPKGSSTDRREAVAKVINPAIISEFMVISHLFVVLHQYCPLLLWHTLTICFCS